MKRIAQTKTPGVLVSELPIKLHLRSDLHLARKLWHCLTGALIAFLYMSGVSVGAAIILLSSGLGLILMIETARLRMPAFNEKMIRLWAPFMRAHEKSQPTATPPYVLATIIAIAVFPKPVAVLSILFLACGDPVASLFGILYGDKSVRFANGKSLVGTIAGVITCFLISFFFLKMMAIPTSAALGISFLGGLAGGLAEHVPVDVDDNFSIPIISGFGLWLAFIIFGI